MDGGASEAVLSKEEKELERLIIEALYGREVLEARLLLIVDLTDCLQFVTDLGKKVVGPNGYEQCFFLSESGSRFFLKKLKIARASLLAALRALETRT